MTPAAAGPGRLRAGPGTCAGTPFPVSTSSTSSNTTKWSQVNPPRPKHQWHNCPSGPNAPKPQTSGTHRDCLTLRAQLIAPPEKNTLMCTRMCDSTKPIPMSEAGAACHVPSEDSTAAGVLLAAHKPGQPWLGHTRSPNNSHPSINPSHKQDFYVQDQYEGHKTPGLTHQHRHVHFTSPTSPAIRSCQPEQAVIFIHLAAARALLVATPNIHWSSLLSPWPSR